MRRHEKLLVPFFELGFKKSGFKKNVNKAIKGDEIEARFVPDAYAIDKENKRILIVEAVVHSDLSEIKLAKLGIFWFDCDFYEWDVTLIVTSGGEPIVVDVGKIFYTVGLDKLGEKINGKSK
jgi:hypothetical protein